ncbi:sensor histidine kinase [Herbidospora cretacea]|uniref:sensor histidine kinase n=1 Tax=Herbidospora cretacea TaxID=28444 RepID=UPI000774343A|nr:ATP-binding protein [Herbidospora cretacea]
MSEELRLREGAGLKPALQEYLSDWSARTGIAVETWALPDAPLPSAVVRAVYAVVAEALTNVDRHSGARHVAIAVTVGATGLRMTISDEGVGFSEGTTGRGLAAMKANFVEIGGTLSINSVLGSGTTLSGVVPKRALRGA